MQRAMRHADIGGGVDGRRERFDEVRRLGRRQQSALSQDDVQGLADGVFLCEKHRTAVESGCDRRGD